MTTKPLDIWVMVDEEGEYCLGHTQKEAHDSYMDNHDNIPTVIHVILHAQIPEPMTFIVNEQKTENKRRVIPDA